MTYAELAIISASDLCRRRAEFAALNSAKKRAEQLLIEAEREADNCRRRGHEEGLLEGRRQALAEAAQSAVQLAALRDETRKNLAELLLQTLAHTLRGPAKEVFYAQFLYEAQQMLGQLRFAHLTVHPDDELALKGALASSAWAHADSPISIACDPALATGDCALVSSAGKVSISLNARLEEVRSAFAEALGCDTGSDVAESNPPRGAA